MRVSQIKASQGSNQVKRFNFCVCISCMLHHQLASLLALDMPITLYIISSSKKEEKRKRKEKRIEKGRNKRRKEKKGRRKKKKTKKKEKEK